MFYDFQRLDRLLFRRGVWGTVLQDLLFWAVATFAVFSFLLLHTNGQPRGFVFVFAAVGFVLFRQTGSRLILVAGRPLKKTVFKLQKFGKAILKFLKKRILRLQNSALAICRRKRGKKGEKKAEKT